MQVGHAKINPSLVVCRLHTSSSPTTVFWHSDLLSATTLNTAEVAHHTISTRDRDGAQQGIVLGPPIRVVAIDPTCSLILSLRSTEVATSWNATPTCVTPLISPPLLLPLMTLALTAELD